MRPLEDGSDAFYVVEAAQLTETALRYLKAFVEDCTDEEFAMEVVGKSPHELEEDDEIRKLKALVNDLRQDRVELQSELEKFRSVDGGTSDTSRLHKLKEDEMKDDIEYFTGENKELHFKVKDVCLQNAQLKLKVAQLEKQIAIEREQGHMSAILAEQVDPADNSRPDESAIETARNIGLEDDMFAPVQELREEESRLARRDEAGDGEGFLSEDSINDVVQQMDEPEQRRSSLAVSADAYKSKLQESEALIISLKTELIKVKQELEDLQQQKEEDDEDSGKSLIPHIRATLINFLRGVPITDKQNEDLLNIIYGMMDFSPTEI